AFKAGSRKNFNKGPAQAQTNQHAHDRAKYSNLHGFQSDHGSDLATLGTYGAQHADLLATFNNAQGQRVDDTQDGDDDSQCQQRIKNRQHLVDEVRGLARVLFTRHHLDDDQFLHGLFQVGAQLIQVIAFFSIYTDKVELACFRRHKVFECRLRYSEAFHNGVGLIDTDEFNFAGFHWVDRRGEFIRFAHRPAIGFRDGAISDKSWVFFQVHRTFHHVKGNHAFRVAIDRVCHLELRAIIERRLTLDKHWRHADRNGVCDAFCLLCQLWSSCRRWERAIRRSTQNVVGGDIVFHQILNRGIHGRAQHADGRDQRKTQGQRESRRRGAARVALRVGRGQGAHCPKRRTDSFAKDGNNGQAQCWASEEETDDNAQSAHANQRCTNTGATIGPHCTGDGQGHAQNQQG